MFISPKAQKLSPLLKYPGGKDKELIHILPNIPTQAQNYYEPFVGGGAVFFALSADNYYLNDRSCELMQLYRLVKERNSDFLHYLTQIDHNWQLVSNVVTDHAGEIRTIYDAYCCDTSNIQLLRDSVSAFVLRNADEFNGLLSTDFNVGIQNFVSELIRNFSGKIVRMKQLEEVHGALSPADFLQNIECAFKSAFYMHFRYLYNHAGTLGIGPSFYTAIYFFLREFCYSSMFRYNAKGQFNVPYGGISYNRKTLTRKIDYFSSSELLTQLEHTQLSCLDFEDFLRQLPPQADDFMFLDPPYDTEFSTYAKNTFGQADQQRLAIYLKNECPCFFMLIIKKTPFVEALYPNGIAVHGGRKLCVSEFSKKYFVSFQNRNDKDASHLLITNY